MNEGGKFLSQHDFDQKKISLTNSCTMQYNTCSVIIAISKFCKTMSVNRSNEKTVHRSFLFNLNIYCWMKYNSY